MYPAKAEDELCWLELWLSEWVYKIQELDG